MCPFTGSGREHSIAMPYGSWKGATLSSKVEPYFELNKFVTKIILGGLLAPLRETSWVSNWHVSIWSKPVVLHEWRGRLGPFLLLLIIFI